MKGMERRPLLKVGIVRTTVRPRGRGEAVRRVRGRRDLKTEAYVFICQKAPSGAELAALLGVSIPTMSRVVAALRREGVDVVSLRGRERARYEVRDTRPWKEIEKDPLLTYVIPKEKVRRSRSKEENRQIYSRD